MGLADRLSSTPPRRTGLPCSVGALLDRLDGDEKTALNAMLYELGWSARGVFEALEAEGYSVGFQTINRHRSRACRCFRAAA